MSQKKVLIIRFSSFGDIAQALFALSAIKADSAETQIHWVTRDDYAEFLESFTGLDKVWSLPRKSGIKELISLAVKLRSENFDLVYDAHSNLRSFVLSAILRFGRPLKFFRRSKERWKRFLLFRLRRNYFPQPFRGGESFCAPLGLSAQNSKPPLIASSLSENKLVSVFKNGDPYVVLAPNAAWPLKMWPLEYWQSFVKTNSSQQFLVVGGPQDHEPAELARLFPDNCTSLAGKLSWRDTLQIICAAKAVVGVDTGVTHLADLMGVPAIFILGPTAFGFPSRASSQVAEIPLSCRPCTKDGRGACRISENKKCLTEVRPNQVSQQLLRIDGASA